MERGAAAPVGRPGPHVNGRPALPRQRERSAAPRYDFDDAGVPTLGRSWTGSWASATNGADRDRHGSRGGSPTRSHFTWGADAPHTWGVLHLQSQPPACNLLNICEIGLALSVQL